MAQTNEVAVLATSKDPLIIRSCPTVNEVKDFVREHNRRFQEGEPGGPTEGSESVQIFSAEFYPTEDDIGNKDLATPIKLPKTVLVQEKK